MLVAVADRPDAARVCPADSAIAHFNDLDDSYLSMVADLPRRLRSRWPSSTNATPRGDRNRLKAPRN